MKSSPSDSRTSQDDIPPVHVLEAAQQQERKETEDLLAGFDRPGRSPKPAPRERDFVGYYAKKKNAGVPSGAGAPAGAAAARAGHAGPKQGDVETMVVPRKREGLPIWMAWAAAAALMLMIGGVVAYLATAESAPRAGAPTGPSAATTITAGTPAPQSDRDTIPPPPPSMMTAESTSATPAPVEEAAAPPVPTTTTATPKATSKRDPKSAPTNAASANGATSASTAPRSTGDGRASAARRLPPRPLMMR